MLELGLELIEEEMLRDGEDEILLEGLLETEDEGLELGLELIEEEILLLGETDEDGLLEIELLIDDEGELLIELDGEELILLEGDELILLEGLELGLLEIEDEILEVEEI